jgi:aarF domain-containing kinase
LRKELGRPIESVYEYVDPTPLASASIAQVYLYTYLSLSITIKLTVAANAIAVYYIKVHGARLKGSQEDVVIKVLKPGIEDILVADLNFVYVVARIIEFLNPEISRTSLVSKIWTLFYVNTFAKNTIIMLLCITSFHSEIFN